MGASVHCYWWQNSTPWLNLSASWSQGIQGSIPIYIHFLHTYFVFLHFCHTLVTQSSIGLLFYSYSKYTLQAPHLVSLRSTSWDCHFVPKISSEEIKILRYLLFCLVGLAKVSKYTSLNQNRYISLFQNMEHYLLVLWTHAHTVDSYFSFGKICTWNKK